MKKERKKYLLAFGFIILAVVLYSFATVQVNELERYEQYLYVDMTDGGLFLDSVKEMRADIAVTGEDGDTTVCNPELGRETQVSTTYCAGNVGVVLPDINGVDLTKTPNECVLSSRAAKELFGTKNVVGRSVNCDGREYIIRGVSDYQIHAENEMIFSPYANESVRCHGAFYIKNKNMSVKMAEQELISNYGISGKVLDIQFVILVIRLITALFLFGVGISVTVLLCRCGRRSEKSSDKLIMQVCFVAVWGVVLYLIGRQVRIPLEQCPAQWSDFDAWKLLAEEKIVSIHLFFDCRKIGFCSMIFLGYLKIAAKTVAAIALYFVGSYYLSQILKCENGKTI